MVKSSILLMSGLVLALTLGSEAEAGKDVIWGPMDAYVTRTPVKKTGKSQPSKKEVSRVEIVFEQMRFVSAMNGNTDNLSPFERAYALKHQ
ncbi:MAG: hypothetical protein K2P93_08880 [Alphaproteobacteria bacterium]|nr:hypothetical protein [Alphaproteobacteria bacterium]